MKLAELKRRAEERWTEFGTTTDAEARAEHGVWLLALPQDCVPSDRVATIRESLLAIRDSVSGELQVGIDLREASWLLRTGESQRAEAVIDSLPLSTTPSHRAHAAILRGIAFYFRQAFEESESSLERGLRIAKEYSLFGLMAQGYGCLCATRFQQGAIEEALQHAKLAAENAKLDGDLQAEGNALSNTASILHSLGRLEEAEKDLACAIELLDGGGFVNDLACARANFASLLHEMGDFDQSRREAILAHRDADPTFRAFPLLELGRLAHTLGRFEEALSRYDKALTHMEQAGMMMPELHAARGAALAQLSRAEEANAAFSVASANVTAATKDQIALLEAHLLLASPSSFESAMAAAKSRVTPERVELAQRSQDTRWALRLLQARLETLGPAAAQVASDGGFFSVDGTRVDLGSRKPLARILRGLAEVHARGELASLERIVELGWPGEALVRQAGARRAYVAISSLRKLGLGNLLERTEDGYRLAPETAIIDPSSVSP